MARKKKTPAKYLKRCPVGTQIQTILLPQKRFQNKSQIRKWLKSNNLKRHKIEKSANYWRIRQKSPSQFRSGSFRTILLGRHGTKAVVACPKTKSRRNPGWYMHVGGLRKGLTPERQINIAHDLNSVFLKIGSKEVSLDPEQAEYLAKLFLEAAEGAEGLKDKSWRKAKKKK